MVQHKIRADCMTVEHTAEWIEALGRYYNWKEAAIYAEKFAQNEFWGLLLQQVTLDMLKTDLEILNPEHRLKIMMAIRYLFPSMAADEGRGMMEIEIECPMWQSSSMASPPWADKMDILPCIDPLALVE